MKNANEYMKDHTVVCLTAMINYVFTESTLSKVISALSRRLLSEPLAILFLDTTSALFSLT